MTAAANPAGPDLLTVKEVAEIFRVHPSTVTRWIEDGELRGIRIGSVVRVARAEVDARLTKPQTVVS